MRSLGMAMLAFAAPAWAFPLKVMTYNTLHGQPCSGGSLGSEVGPRMELAAIGPAGGCTTSDPRHTCGLADLAPDVLGLQEVSQVLVDQELSANETCAIFQATGQLDPRVTKVDAYEHAGDHLLRAMNRESALRHGESPYKMRFVRDNPRLLPLVPDVPLPPDDKTLSDIAAEGGDVEIGIAVISKFRIQQVTVHNLTIGAQPGETRAILHATIQIPDATGHELPYDFYDTHVTTTGGDSPQTLVMAAEIIRFVATTRRNPERAGFLTCDCNFTEGPLLSFPPSVTLGFPPNIDGPRAYQLFVHAGFVDTYRAANPSPSPTDSTSGRDGLSTACNQASADGRIDYVWAIPSQGGSTPAVTASRIVMDYAQPLSGGGCRYPSDHDGVITTFDIQ